MVANRQDAWTEEEDLLLAETVLRHIREGGTQLAGFEEVAEKLSRTSAACGFRWNSTIRRKYEAEIKMAKRKRVSSRQRYRKEQHEQDLQKKEISFYKKNESSMQRATPPNINMDMIIAYLQELGDKQADHQHVHALTDENRQLRARLEALEKEKETIAKDYRALIDIMERARHLTVDRAGETQKSM
ncbi:RsfA family transcriptional regulator [Shouchella lonarensis]|uniref:Transcription factor, RsfA family n=1 Tax=Shouchella lonarensis TaxID=1464122 RepID=A0A1G6KUP8_9BACI|nr:RsfA family transcriptional regulator [Shouchella lonarensis]SDC34683.1 transcription factor, RsfA family [Shouchella lonarensis]